MNKDLITIYNWFNFEDNEEILDWYIDTEDCIHIKYIDADEIVGEYISGKLDDKILKELKHE